MAFHHIIPVHLLRDFYVAIMNTGDTELRQQFFNFLGRMADIYTITVPEHNDSPDDLRKVLFEEPNIEWIENTLSYRQMVRRLYTWMPFNVFEGPIGEYRDDDPGSNFEANSMRIVGSQIFQNLQRLHHDMLSYISRGQNIDGTIAIAGLMRLLNQRNTPFRFNVHHWRMSRETEDNPKGRDMFEIIPMDKASHQQKRSVENEITMTRDLSCRKKKC